LERIEEAYTKQKVASKNYDIMRFWEKAFSESGLVRFLIRNILKYFNDRTNFYLSHLSRGKFSIEFDEELNETITHYGRKIDFISMSGGEKKKVSLAVTLGLQSLLTRTSRSENNLIFFDEIAESLDQDGIYGLYILLQELKKDKVLFVITHNNYLKSLLDNSKTLTIMKSDGISSLKE
jgi:DNA repair exonuclease SbcCD ATPase subunit